MMRLENGAKQKEPEMTKPSLYQTKETPVRYGTFLIKNSGGQMVLEMKGEGGKVESFDENAIEVVTHYTVELTALDKGHLFMLLPRRAISRRMMFFWN
jgi:hypothetical protein